MKFPNGNYYVEVKGHQYRNLLSENNFLGLREGPKPLKTHYHVQNEAQIRKN